MSNSINELFSLLQNSGDSDIVNLDVANYCISVMKKDKVLNIHKYAITKPSGNVTRWQTYVKEENKPRKKIISPTENGLYDMLYDFYFERTIYTIDSLYPEWLEYRSQQGISSRTVARNKNHYDKYYRNSKLVSIPIQKIDYLAIETFLYDCIRKYKMTVKELNNMKFIVEDIFRYALRHKIVSYNPNNDVDIKTIGCKPPKKKNDISKFYTPEECEKMFVSLNEELLKHPEKTYTYAIFLLFKLGLRIGEVCALKWSDIDFLNREIHIHRMETRDTDSSGNEIVVVVEHTKKKSLYGDRFLPLSDYELNLFKTVKAINQDNGYAIDDYIFCNSYQRCTIASLDRLIRKCCKRANIEEKSAHDIRRTVASEMYKNGISPLSIRDFLGHSDIKTTYGYIFDNVSKQNRANSIFNSLNSMNGISCSHLFSNCV